MARRGKSFARLQLLERQGERGVEPLRASAARKGRKVRKLRRQRQRLAAGRQRSAGRQGQRRSDCSLVYVQLTCHGAVAARHATFLCGRRAQRRRAQVCGRRWGAVAQGRKCNRKAKEGAEKGSAGGRVVGVDNNQYHESSQSTPKNMRVGETPGEI